MPDVVMPRLSDSMEEGTILKWLKADGDEVARGDELVEIETDKATMTYEADTAGALTIVAQEGETHPIGAVIAQLGEAGEAPVQDAESPGEATTAAAAAAGDGDGDGDGGEPPAPAATQAPPPEAAPEPEPEAAPGPEGNGGRPKASPVARRIARERGVDLTALSGSGPGGRIVKADVEAAAGGESAAAPETVPAVAEPEPEPAAPPAPAAAADGGAKGEVTVEEPTRTQQVIARRMAESKATVPEFTISVVADMEGAVALRTQLKEVVTQSASGTGTGEASGGTVPSYNDMVVKACGLALREHPRANGSYKDGRFELYGRVNVGVAVAAHDSLVVPTIFDADRKSLGEIARDARALAGRVRASAITPPELGGGTFTVSNLGMFGISSFTAVINPPQAAILAVGRMEPTPVVRDGEVVVRNVMSLTLACDHRILYGAQAAEFLARIRALLEQPLALAL